MPISCDEANCPLQSAGTLPKFCPECGCSPASKMRSACASCGLPFEGTPPKFCTECGSRTAAEPEPPREPPRAEPLVRDPDGRAGYKHWRDLVRNHEEQRRGPAGGTSARGLTDEERARLERSLRAPVDRTYVDRDPEGEAAYRDITRRIIPSEEMNRRAGVPEASGRVAARAPDGQHRPGQLMSKDVKWDPKAYANEVRVIPYSFRTPTRSRDVVGGGKRNDETPMTPEEERKFYEGMDEDADRQLTRRPNDSSE